MECRKYNRNISKQIALEKPSVSHQRLFNNADLIRLCLAYLTCSMCSEQRNLWSTCLLRSSLRTLITGEAISVIRLVLVDWLITMVLADGGKKQNLPGFGSGLVFCHCVLGRHNRLSVLTAGWTARMRSIMYRIGVALYSEPPFLFHLFFFFNPRKMLADVQHFVQAPTASAKDKALISARRLWCSV